MVNVNTARFLRKAKADHVDQLIALHGLIFDRNLQRTVAGATEEERDALWQLLEWPEHDQREMLALLHERGHYLGTTIRQLSGAWQQALVVVVAVISEMRDLERVVRGAGESNKATIEGWRATLYGRWEDIAVAFVTSLPERSDLDLRDVYCELVRRGSASGMLEDDFVAALRALQPVGVVA